jgi:hypothetical protein
MATETQQHPLADGSTVSISRNGNHQYWVDGGPKMQSVTSLTKHISGDNFGVGVNWALKLARENGGDLDAPKRLSKESLDSGTELHRAIDDYIKHGTIDESPLFMLWFNKVGQEAWLASETFLYHPGLEPGYGGTSDALALNDSGTVTIYDWKTRETESYEKYGGYLQETAQLAAYADALTTMGSRYAPTRGCIAYVMRDGSYVDVVEVDLAYGSSLFAASRDLHLLTKRGG